MAKETKTSELARIIPNGNKTLSIRDEASVSRMIDAVEQAFLDRQSGLIDNHTANALGALAQQYCQLWVILLRATDR